MATKSFKSVPLWAWLALAMLFVLGLIVGIAQATSQDLYVDPTPSFPVVSNTPVTGFTLSTYLQFRSDYAAGVYDQVTTNTWTKFGSPQTCNGWHSKGAFYMADSVMGGWYSTNIPDAGGAVTAWFMSFSFMDSIQMSQGGSLPTATAGLLWYTSLTTGLPFRAASGIGAANGSITMRIDSSCNMVTKVDEVAGVQTVQQLLRPKTIRTTSVIFNDPALVPTTRGMGAFRANDTLDYVNVPTASAYSHSGFRTIQLGDSTPDLNRTNMVIQYLIVLRKNTLDSLSTTDITNLNTFLQSLRSAVPTGTVASPFRSLDMVEWKLTKYEETTSRYRHTAGGYLPLKDTTTINLAAGTYTLSLPDNTDPAYIPVRSQLKLQNSNLYVWRNPTLPTNALVKVRGKIYHAAGRDEYAVFKNLVLSNPSDTLFYFEGDAGSGGTIDTLINISFDSCAIAFTGNDYFIPTAYASIFSPNTEQVLEDTRVSNIFACVYDSAKAIGVSYDETSVNSTALQWRPDGTYRLLSYAVARSRGGVLVDGVVYGLNDAGAIQYRGGGIAGWGTQQWGTGAWGTQAWGTKKW